MQAREGDRIVIHGQTVGKPDRAGTVLEIRGSVQHTMYRVAWDDGTQSTYMPAAGVAIVEDSAPGMEAAEVRLGMQVDVEVIERDDACLAAATLTTLRGTFRGEGEAHRHPDDPEVPMIGEELAIGRALESLAKMLLAEAGEAIADHETRPIHLVSP